MVPVIRPLLILLTLFVYPVVVLGDTATVAVASNFATTLDQLAIPFEQGHAHQLAITPGASGKHYAQIIHGAPYDIFMSADQKRPEMLELQSLTVPDSRFTYALGQLVLLSPGISRPKDLPGRIADHMHMKLAIANPAHAPYGQAARQLLIATGLWEDAQPHLVTGENINQAFQFVLSGNAGLGIVALSQINTLDSSEYIRVPESLYQPIRQQAVQLTENPAATAFMAYLKSDRAVQIIKSSGYSVP